jgi:hypothetical protein
MSVPCVQATKDYLGKTPACVGAIMTLQTFVACVICLVLVLCAYGLYRSFTFQLFISTSCVYRRIFGLNNEKSFLVRVFGRNPICLPAIQAVYESKSQSVRWWGRMIEHAYSIFWNPRTCPAVMFFAEALTKIALVILTATVLIVEYNDETYVGGNSMAERGVLFMWACSIAYEVGVVISIKQSFVEYVSTFWNSVHLVSYVLIFVWAVTFRSPHLFDCARICLSVASIPLSIGILEYLSAIRSLGHLVIIVVAMMLDVANFLVIYIVCIVAFSICFNGLFSHMSLYQFSSGQTFLSMCSYSVHNFMFDQFSTPDKDRNSVGEIVLIVYVTLTSIVLINLLIARMASTHNKITEKAVQEWSFTRVSYLAWTVLSSGSPRCLLFAIYFRE